MGSKERERESRALSVALIVFPWSYARACSHKNDTPCFPFIDVHLAPESHMSILSSIFLSGTVRIHYSDFSPSHTQIHSS